jgi:hypothetical protein
MELAGSPAYAAAGHRRSPRRKTNRPAGRGQRGGHSLPARLRPPPGEMPPAYLYSSLDPIHTLTYTAIHGTLTSPDLQSLLAFTASPLSSVLLVT